MLEAEAGAEAGGEWAADCDEAAGEEGRPGAAGGANALRGSIGPCPGGGCGIIATDQSLQFNGERQKHDGDVTITRL